MEIAIDKVYEFNATQLIKYYDITEGFIPLKDKVVYVVKLKKLDIKAAYEIDLFDGVEYVFDKENPNKSYFTKKNLEASNHVKMIPTVLKLL